MLGGGPPGLAGLPLCCLVPHHHSAPVFTCAERVCNCYLAESLKGFNEMTYMKEVCELQKLNQYLVLKNQSK